jgi:hypothetical protein
MRSRGSSEQTPRGRRILVRAGRIAAIVAFGAAVFWFGHRNSPLAPPAEASIYQLMGEGFAGVPSVWELQVDPGAVQVAELNGNHIFYTVERDWRSVSQVLDYYEQLYSASAKMPSVEEVPLKGKKAEDYETFLHEIQPMIDSGVTRMQTDEWGIFGAFVLPDPSDPGFAEEMESRFRAFEDSGKLSDVGDAKFVYALRPPGASETTVMAAWPSRDFDVRAVATDGTQDAPGSDPPDVPRLPGDVRLLSFAQDRPEMTFHMASYESRSSEQQALDFYSTHLPKYDWAEDTGFGAVAGARGPSRLFTRGRQQCHVSVREDPETLTAVASVLVTGPPGSLNP